jgi:hypothetical protein
VSILSSILGVESGGQNITQELGTRDVNNNYGAGGGDPAQGYFQITGATWQDFGGLNTGYSSAIDAPYATQLAIAQNIPVARWGPDTQSALQAGGYQPQQGETLGQMLERYGEGSGGSPSTDLNGSGIASQGGGAGGIPNGALGWDTGGASGASGSMSGDIVTGAGAGSGTAAGVASGGDTLGFTGSTASSDWTKYGPAAVGQAGSAIATAISGAIKSAGDSTTSWFGAGLDTAKNLVLRGVLGLLAILLIIAALFLMTPMGRNVTPEVIAK